MYVIEMDGREYTGHRDGRPFTLVDAMREVYGVGRCRILRSDGTVVVDHAGSSVEVVHAPTGRTVRRRPARPARQRNAAQAWRALRGMTRSETVAYLAGWRHFPGAVETDHGVMVPATTPIPA